MVRLIEPGIYTCKEVPERSYWTDGERGWAFRLDTYSNFSDLVRILEDKAQPWNIDGNKDRFKDKIMPLELFNW